MPNPNEPWLPAALFNAEESKPPIDAPVRERWWKYPSELAAEMGDPALAEEMRKKEEALNHSIETKFWWGHRGQGPDPLYPTGNVPRGIGYQKYLESLKQEQDGSNTTDSNAVVDGRDSESITDTINS